MIQQSSVCPKEKDNHEETLTQLPSGTTGFTQFSPISGGRNDDGNTQSEELATQSSSANTGFTQHEFTQFSQSATTGFTQEEVVFTQFSQRATAEIPIVPAGQTAELSDDAKHKQPKDDLLWGK
ncbi:hypothetical protein ACA910_005438 [Epithemia clementina (nom. ined.)]